MESRYLSLLSPWVFALSCIQFEQASSLLSYMCFNQSHLHFRDEYVATKAAEDRAAAPSSIVVAIDANDNGAVEGGRGGGGGGSGGIETSVPCIVIGHTRKVFTTEHRVATEDFTPEIRITPAFAF